MNFWTYISDEVSEVDDENNDVEMPVPPSCGWVNGIDGDGLLQVNDNTLL